MPTVCTVGATSAVESGPPPPSGPPLELPSPAAASPPSDDDGTSEPLESHAATTPTDAAPARSPRRVSARRFAASACIS